MSRTISEYAVSDAGAGDTSRTTFVAPVLKEPSGSSGSSNTLTLTATFALTMLDPGKL